MGAGSNQRKKSRGIKGHFTRADRWLILIFYMIGLAVGVHLLPILTIPAIVMVYYFKRYKTTKWKTFWAFVIACLITGIVQVPMIQWSIKFAGQFRYLFQHRPWSSFLYRVHFLFCVAGCCHLSYVTTGKKKELEFFETCHVEFCFCIAGILHLLYNPFPFSCRSRCRYV